ncbi:MAG: chorismate synthase [Deltaproteobacteria bacterium]
MAGSSIGQVFRVTTWGESHGEAMGVIIDGCPPNIKISNADIQIALDIRKPAQGAYTTNRKEADTAEILSGIFEGKTTGTPIAIMVRNNDAKSSDYEKLRDIFRPGHGDYSYDQKYGFRDYRGGGRASGRETVARVAAGAVAEKVIAKAGIIALAYTKAIGNVIWNDNKIPLSDDILKSVLLCPDDCKTKEMLELLELVKLENDSVGGVVEIVVQGCPAGLGEPVFDKLDADLAKGLMSIGAVKGVEIGAGFAVAKMRGSKCNDAILQTGFATNNAGGILAGISNGDTIVVRATCKPIPSIDKSQSTINKNGESVAINIGGRHDVCVIPRIVPVCEAMVKIILADHLLRQEAILSWVK